MVCHKPESTTCCLGTSNRQAENPVTRSERSYLRVHETAQKQTNIYDCFLLIECYRWGMESKEHNDDEKRSTVTRKPRQRRTQDQRTAETIGKLADATIGLIAEIGFANVTTTRIAKRAGVSRGAMLHHFPSKSALIIYATGEMWGRVVAASEKLSADSDPDNPDPKVFVDTLWSGAMAPTNVSVSADIMLAARGNAELQAHLDLGVKRMFDSYRRAGLHAFGKTGLSVPECHALIDSVSSTLRGLRLAQMLSPDADREKAVLAMLVEMLRSQLSKVSR